MVQNLAGFEFRCGRCPTAPPVPTDHGNSTAALAQAINAINATLKQLSDRLGQLEAKVNATPPPPPPSDIVDVQEMIEEAILKHENRNQLVIAGVPEEVDVAAYTTSLFDRLEVDSYEIVEAYRMGRRREGIEEGGSPTDQQDRPRLVKVRLARAQQRDQVLASAKNLRDDTDFPVYIRPSRTPKERRQIADLYDQKREMEDTTGKQFYIRRSGPVSEWSILPASPRRNVYPRQNQNSTNASK